MLLEAVNSALSQDLPPDEVIVVDNGTVAVDHGTLPPGVIYRRLAPRVGPSVARNHGARQARSEWIAFLDDDDLWDRAYLREAMAALAQEKAECVFGQRCLVAENGPVPYKLPTRETLTVPVLLLRNPGTAPSSVVLRRDLFLRIGGFDEQLMVSEDRALTLELLRSKALIAIAPRACALIREHDLGHLRLRQGRKLRFLWKYRALHTPLTFGAELLRILAKVVLAALPGGNRIATLLGRGSSRHSALGAIADDRDR
jgi:glycosyltransferase involved in cell wall biosynthesis